MYEHVYQKDVSITKILILKRYTGYAKKNVSQFKEEKRKKKTKKYEVLKYW